MRHAGRWAARAFEQLATPARIALVAVATLLCARAAYLTWLR